jgi:hypothetical protein
LYATSGQTKLASLKSKFTISKEAETVSRGSGVVAARIKNAMSKNESNEVAQKGNGSTARKDSIIFS